MEIFQSIMSVDQSVARVPPIEERLVQNEVKLSQDGAQVSSSEVSLLQSESYRNQCAARTLQNEEANKREVWRKVMPYVSVKMRAFLGSCSKFLRHLAWQICSVGQVDLLRHGIGDKLYALLNYPALPWAEQLAEAVWHLNLPSVQVILEKHSHKKFTLMNNDFLLTLARLPDARQRLQIILHKYTPIINPSLLIELARANHVEMADTLLAHMNLLYFQPYLVWRALLCGKGKRWFFLGMKYVGIFDDITYTDLCYARDSSLTALNAFVLHCKKNRRIKRVIEIAKNAGDEYILNKLRES